MTVREHLRLQLVENIYELAIKNTIKQGNEKFLEIDLDNPPANMMIISMLIYGKIFTGKDALTIFDWKKSEEGEKFWINISTMLRTEYL